MRLECTLVKARTVDTVTGKFLARSRYDVSTEAEALEAVSKFLAENVSTFSAALSDQRLVSQLQSISGLTIGEFRCLRYILALRGIDVWCWYVKEAEINPDEIGDNTYEYNVLDPDVASACFPMCYRIVQSTTENSLCKLYDSISEAYDLFNGSLFVGQVNPIKNMVAAMKADEDAVGTVSNMKTTYVNSILDFLGKTVKVVTD